MCANGVRAPRPKTDGQNGAPPHPLFQNSGLQPSDSERTPQALDCPRSWEAGWAMGTYCMRDTMYEEI